MGSQLYFYRKTLLWANTTGHRSRNRWICHSVFALFNIPVLFVIALRPHLLTLPEWFKLTMVYPFYIWHFSWFLIFLLVIIWKIFAFPVWGLKKISGFSKTPVQSPPPDALPPVTPPSLNSPLIEVNHGRRLFIRRGTTVLVGSAFLGTAYSTYGRDQYTIEDISIPIKGLPLQFEGFSIGMISDVHSSIFMTKEQMQIYARAVNALKTDLIVVTGDFVNSMLDEVHPFAEAFSELSAPHGVFGVLGNHDYFTKQVDLVAKEVDQCGIHVLRNESVIIDRNGAKLALMGSDDIGIYRRAEVVFDSLIKGLSPGIPTILLCHRPYFFPQAAERNIDLTLSGHTHGGQIVFAKLGNEVIAPARFASPYMAGTYTIGHSNMYVNRGLGTVGIPMRLNCPPELTKIKLIRA